MGNFFFDYETTHTMMSSLRHDDEHVIVVVIRLLLFAVHFTINQAKEFFPVNSLSSERVRDS